jgi:GT2 family glycosyltransferase
MPEGDAIPSGGAGNPVVAGLLVSRRRPRDTDETLAQVVAQTLPLRLLVVVNVEADPETQGVVAAWSARHPHVEYLPVAENVGPAGAVGIGVELVLRRCPEAQFIALFEDDEPPPDPGSLARLVGHLDRQDPAHRIGGVGFSGAQFSARSAILQRPRLTGEGGADVDYISGGYMPVFRRALLDEVGTYDRTLFFGLEELEFGLRARDAGWRLQIIGADWGERRRAGVTLRDWSWRRYYTQRNLIVILLRRKRWLTALYVAVGRGLIKPLLWLPKEPRLAGRYLRYNAAAFRDAVTGRLGLTLPPQEPSA